MQRDPQRELADLMNEVRWLDKQHQHLRRRAEYVRRRLAELAGDAGGDAAAPPPDVAADRPEPTEAPAPTPPTAEAGATAPTGVPAAAATTEAPAATVRDRLGRVVHLMGRDAAGPSESGPRAASPSRPLVGDRSRLDPGTSAAALWLVAAAFALAAAAFAWYAVDRGWAPVAARSGTIAVVAAGLIVAGARMKLAGHRAGGGVLLVAALAGLYAAAYIAGPDVDGILSARAMLGALCAVTLLGGGVAAGVGSLPGAVAAVAGGYLTPMAVGIAEHKPGVWMVYLLVLTGGALLMAARRRWNSLSALALAGALVLMSMWIEAFFAPAGVFGVVGFSWCLAGLFIIYAATAVARGALGSAVGMVIVGVVAAAMVALLAGLSPHMVDYAVGIQWLALNAVVLGLCLRLRWGELRLAALAWTVAGVAFLWSRHDVGAVVQLVWVGAFYVLFAADVVLWAFAGGCRDAVGAVVVAVSTAVMVPTAWELSAALLGPWVGPCAAGVGVLLILLGLLVRMAPARPAATTVYVIAGLTCLVIAVPPALEGTPALVGCAVAAGGLLGAALLIRTRPLRFAAWGLLAAVAVSVGWSYLPALPLPWRVGACVWLAVAAMAVGEHYRRESPR